MQEDEKKEGLLSPNESCDYSESDSGSTVISTVGAKFLSLFFKKPKLKSQQQSLKYR